MKIIANLYTPCDTKSFQVTKIKCSQHNVLSPHVSTVPQPIAHYSYVYEHTTHMHTKIKKTARVVCFLLLFYLLVCFE